MSKHLHKIYFWVVSLIFVVTLSMLYVSTQKTIFGVVYPNDVVVEGDTLFGTDIKAGGQDFTSGTFNWASLTSEVSAKINNLVGTTPCTKPNIRCSGNISQILEDLNPDQKPEGQMWYYTGGANIDIGNIVANGKGTIIIKGYDLKISGSIEYEPSVGSSIGFIVLQNGDQGGTIEIEKEVSTLYGAYYAQKQIIFKYIE